MTDVLDEELNQVAGRLDALVVASPASPASPANPAEQLHMQPRVGRLVPLRTKDEVRAALETLDAYIVGVAEKSAGAALNAIKAVLPDLNRGELQHLRHVAGFDYLPQHLQATLSPAQSPTVHDDVELGMKKKQKGQVRYILVGPASCMEKAKLEYELARKAPFNKAWLPPKLFAIPVPALAPTSAEQAARWSLDYWPISYKNTNPYGPHPSIVSRETKDIEKDAGLWLALADRAASQTSGSDLGDKVGCVVISKTGHTSEIIAVAGDCRWRSPNGDPTAKECPGNPMAHAAQRAIAMVAKKRLRAAGTDANAGGDSSVFCNTPVTELEKQYFHENNAPASGYLCLDLDIYLTHEPCVMCSMALLHSRFRRCVFGRRMPFTGGLTADKARSETLEYTVGELGRGGLGQGICWRPSELNWKFLTWEWEDQYRTRSTIAETLHA
ncbi:cytidine deaminase-like protein [Clohesyomyces aquaticus]|uniref:Cytidine deaminase-like protein n=1 Tax=Clohesyomyces aquaticus TaxID=1231657 RepID=A0A1Y1YWV3_9PLEO|nr:cytidine deaminase-like protein [Clohesyomyces aquaticus]